MQGYLDDPAWKPTAVVVVVFVLVFVIVVLGLQTYFSLAANEEMVAKIEAAPLEAVVARVRAEQLQALNEYRWVDRDAGTVTIPIERAMELAARDLNAEARAR